MEEKRLRLLSHQLSSRLKMMMTTRKPRLRSWWSLTLRPGIFYLFEIARSGEKDNEKKEREKKEFFPCPTCLPSLGCVNFVGVEKEGKEKNRNADLNLAVIYLNRPTPPNFFSACLVLSSFFTCCACIQPYVRV